MPPRWGRREGSGSGARGWMSIVGFGASPSGRIASPFGAADAPSIDLGGGHPSIVIFPGGMSSWADRRGRFIVSCLGPQAGLATRSTRAAASASKFGSLCRVTWRRPRASTRSSRRASRTSASACPPSPRPFPPPEVSSRMHHAHRPLRPRRVSIGEARLAAHAAKLAKDQAEARAARGRGGGEAVATPSPDRRPRRRFRLARARHEAPPSRRRTRDTGENPRRTRAVVMKAKVCVRRLQQNKRRRVHPIPGGSPGRASRPPAQSRRSARPVCPKVPVLPSSLRVSPSVPNPGTITVPYTGCLSRRLGCFFTHATTSFAGTGPRDTTFDLPATPPGL